MAYQCRVERDSVSPAGIRLTSFVISYPRVVIAEAATHRNTYDCTADGDVRERTTTRDISKNSASSRAIPIKRMLAAAREDPYVPEWTMHAPGMQGRDADDPHAISDATSVWLLARDEAVERVEQMHFLGLSKQNCNRLLEPFVWVTQLVTSSAWENFFALRCHESADPAIRKIARMMFLARRASTPTPLAYGQWHIPFVPIEDQQKLEWYPRNTGDDIPDLLKFSAARCAWVSYGNAEGEGTPAKMLATWKRLTTASPPHASPTEHQATPMLEATRQVMPEWRSNLDGWLQLRRLIRGETTRAYAPSDEEIASWGLTDLTTDTAGVQS